ncbi:MAG: UDP-N-acetylmuramate--L-alanine ligase [Bacteroidota bacterium]
MEISQLKYIYFLGIGGIGMSAIARWFVANGYAVAGYDKTPTPLTEALTAEGAIIHFEDDINLIPSAFLENISETLVVYTPAIPKDHLEFNWLKDNGFTLNKRSQVLGLLTQKLFTIAVAGTHGKTTTSSMVTHILKQSGKNVTAFLGGITQNYGTNFLINDHPNDIICVVEADEFDRSFLTLSPDISIVTSTDADHLDIYGSHEHVLESFQLFVDRLKPNGTVYVQANQNLKNGEGTQQFSYSLQSGDYFAENLRIEEAIFKFDLRHPNGIIKGIEMALPGYHNVENAIAASAACLQVGVNEQDIVKSLASFGGVKRRFEYHIRTKNLVYIDDYAHHPTEIEAFLSSVKALYPHKKLTAIFQPHLFSRTNDFQEDFAKSLELADDLILMNIYPARELPMEGVTSAIIFDKIHNQNKTICAKENLLNLIRSKKPELLVTIGAGDIDTFITPIKSLLNELNSIQ